jgi:hypothetical protein
MMIPSNSFVEANLSCICGALTTIRPLLNHIAPRLLGPSPKSKYTGSSGLSNSVVPPTIGTGESGNLAQNRRDPYDILDDDIMYPLETVVVGRGGNESTSEAGGRCADSGSETAIMTGEPAIVETRTTAITDEVRR